MATAELKDTASPLRANQRLIAGRYRTHARIGQGRLGEIFTATDEIFEEIGVEQHLALQEIPANVVANNKLFNRLNVGYSELRARAHPNIVDYRQFGRNGKLGFLTMERLEGSSLRDVLAGAGTLPLEEVKPVIAGVGEGLRFLHGKDIVHGNLSTGSVFITEGLEVRLLDVVPLDPAEALVRANAASQPFSRPTFEDDVFGLACLAYEMLAGKQPFNGSPPAEARRSGLEAERIVSLTDAEWNALRRALAFDDDQRTSSIADFMRDLGISGTENLKATGGQPTKHEAAQHTTAEETSLVTRPVAPEQITVSADPVVAVDPVVSNENNLPQAKLSGKRGRPLRTVLLGILLTSLGAWAYFGQPDVQIADWYGHIEQRFGVGLTAETDGLPGSRTADPAPSVPTERIAPVDRPAATAPAAVIEPMNTDSERELSEPEPAASVDEIGLDVAQPYDPPAPLGPPTLESVSGASDPAGQGAADEGLPDAASMQTQPDAIVIEPIVSVSERDSAVRIAPAGIENLSAPLIWWTSEHTASADTDFIPVEQQFMAEATALEGYVLYVSLVNDNLPEPPESFFVNLGFRNDQQGRIERVATVRVDIVDDD